MYERTKDKRIYERTNDHRKEENYLPRGIINVNVYLCLYLSTHSFC